MSELDQFDVNYVILRKKEASTIVGLFTNSKVRTKNYYLICILQHNLVNFSEITFLKVQFADFVRKNGGWRNFFLSINEQAGNKQM